MAIGIGTALLGSALFGGGLSLFGAKQANQAAETQSNAALNASAIQAQAYRDAIDAQLGFQERALETQTEARDRALAATTGTTPLSSYYIKSRSGWAKNALTRGTRTSLDRLGVGLDRAVRSIDSNTAIALRQYAPYADIGGSAAETLANLYGVGPDSGEAFSANALDAFRRSPDYQFALKEGTRALDFSNAAKGSLGSRGHLNALVQYGQGLASQNFGNYASRLAGLSNLGLTAAGARASLYGSKGNALANLYGNYGNAASTLASNEGRALAALYTGQGADLARLYGAGADRAANINLGYGTNAANTLAAMGQTQGAGLIGAGNALGAGMLNAGQAQAAGTVGAANALTQGFGNITNQLLAYNALAGNTALTNPLAGYNALTGFPATG